MTRKTAVDRIEGKTVAITGAARGIGYATAKALLARGARVVIGDRDVARLESAVAALSDRLRAFTWDDMAARFKTEG